MNNDRDLLMLSIEYLESKREKCKVTELMTCKVCCEVGRRRPQYLCEDCVRFTKRERSYIRRLGYDDGIDLIKASRKLDLSHCHVCGWNFIIDIHHRDKNPRNNDIDNLIPLCKNCHCTVHSKMLTPEELRSRLHEFRTELCDYRTM